MPTTQAFRRIFGDNFFYILYFQEPGPADAELARDPATTMRRCSPAPQAGDEAAALRMLAPGPDGFLDRIPEPGGLPEWISQDEFDHYVDEFTRNGFTGAAELVPLFRPQLGAHGRHPGGDDRGARPVHRRHRRRDAGVHAAPPRQRSGHGHYREVMIDGAGHWLMEERPDKVSGLLIEFFAYEVWLG